ncbi:MAG: vitamin K epoxide reductase family protein [Blastocatellia bacterium]
MMNPATYTAVALAAIGLYIASYFTLVYYGIVPASIWLMPSICRLEERTCQTVLNTRYARVFGVPNSLLGALYYIVVITTLLCGWTTGLVGTGLIVVAWFTVALGIFLAYSLFFIIRIPCPLCLAGHTINLALAVLLTIILR